MFPHYMIEALRMLEYRRPMGSKTETAFRDRFLLTLPGAFADTFGNIHVKIGESRTLFSSHTDTVHTIGGFQTLHVDHKTSIVQLSRKARSQGSNCLGADCTIGVWIMRNMILRGVDGYYIFHYGEEKGGIGSSALARKHAAWLTERFDFAVAFDRRKRGSIITHQQWYRTASETFACSLAAEILRVNPDLTFASDDGGIYTDTAEYADYVPECTNLSVGYVNEHRDTETADLAYADQVLRAMCAIDWRNVDKARDPNAHDMNDDRQWTWIGKKDHIMGSFTYDPAYKIGGNVSNAIDCVRIYSGANGDPVFGTCITCGEGTWIDRRSFECIDCADDDDPNNPANHATDCPTYETGEYSDCDCYWKDVIAESRTSTDRTFDRAIYLSPEYAEVQADLIDTLKRRRNAANTGTTDQDKHANHCTHYADGCADCTCGLWDRIENH